MREFLATARRRLRAAWAAATAQLVLPVVAGGIALIAGAAWLVRHPVPVWVIPVVLIMFLAGVAIWARFLRITDYQAARAVERGLHADDVLTTALEFHDADDPLHRSVQARARTVVEGGAVDRAIPIRWRPRRLGVAAGLVVAAVGFAILSPLGGGPTASAEDRAILAEEADALEGLAAEIEQTRDTVETDGAHSELDDLADQLRDLADDVRDASSLDQAIDELEHAADRLGAEVADDLFSRKAAVRGLEQQLGLNPLAGSSGGSAAEQLDQVAAALGGLTAEQRAQLAERLDALAETQSQANPEVSEQLREAAEQLREGNQEQASSALSRAAEGQRRSNDDLAVDESTTAGAAAASQAAERIRAAAPSDGEGEGEGSDGEGDGPGEGGTQGQGDTDTPGTGTGQGDDEGDGQGQGAGDGGGQGGGGTAAGGASGPVSGADPSGESPSGQGGVGTPGEGDPGGPQTPIGRATVFEPVEAGPGDEVQVGIEGGQGQGDVLGQGDAPTQRGDALVPYTDVLPGYLAAAATALDELSLPTSLRSTVRTYFDNLAEGPR